MGNLILLSVFLMIGCSQIYNVDVAKENALLKNLLLVNITSVTNRVESVTVNGGSGVVSTGGSGGSTGGGIVISAPGSSGSYANLSVTARNYSVLIYNTNANSSFFSYYEAETVCSSAGMLVVSKAEIEAFAKIVTQARLYPGSVSQYSYDLWEKVKGGYFRFWIRDIDSGLEDSTVAYFYDTNPYDSRYLGNMSIRRKAEKFMSILCFK